MKINLFTKSVVLVLAVVSAIVIPGISCLPAMSVSAVDETSDVSDTANETPDYVMSCLKLKHELRFNNDGTFKIVIFSDIQDNYPPKEDTITYMNKILDSEQPDLVLLGGDNHCGTITSLGTMKKYLAAIAEPMESRQIPYAHIYGNHVEGYYGYLNPITKQKQEQIFESFDYCISKAGNVYGIGNYVLPVLRSDGGKIGFNVFCLDSHSYLENYQKGLEAKAILPRYIYNGNVYDPIHFEQIKWYWDTSVALEEYNGSLIPAMMLFHIPLYEWNYIIQNPDETGMTGAKGEEVCAPELNSGLFAACYQRGDVKGLFCGHDHVNDFSGVYMGIRLSYVPTIGTYEYFDAKNRGARVIEINQDDAFNFTTRMVYCKDLEG